jgi:hypothetical protein
MTTERGPYPWFTDACIEAFAFLVSKYGFIGPKVKQAAYERYVSYEKPDRIVSIYYEPGLLPLVELFYPTREIKNRYIPHLTPNYLFNVDYMHEFHAQLHNLAGGQKYAEFDALVKKQGDELRRDMLEYLKSQADALESQERSFLLGEKPNKSKFKNSPY